MLTIAEAMKAARRDALVESWCLRIELTHPHIPPSRRPARARSLISAYATTRCPHGHRYTPDNTYRRPNGKTECQTCRRSTAARHRDGDVEYMRLAPLLALLRWRHELDVVDAPALAEHVEIDEETALRWLLARRLTVDEADRTAITLGLHPSAIWDDWFNDPGAIPRTGLERSSP